MTTAAHLILEPVSHYRDGGGEAEAHSNMFSERGGDDIWILITAMSQRLEQIATNPITEDEAYTLLSEMLAEVAAVHAEATDSDVLDYVEGELADLWQSAFDTELDRFSLSV